MLFWIFLIIFAIGIAWYVVDEYCDGAMFLTAISGILVCISLLIIGCTHIGVDGYIDQMNTRYETLVYQYENNIYDNDNDLGKRELMVDIQSWNEDLANKKVIQDDFWIGIYTPDIYDQFKFIELDRED